MKKYLLSAFFIFTSSVLFFGCFDAKREIKFFPNGGGEENLTVTLDKDFFDKLQTLTNIEPSWKKKADTLKDNILLESEFRDDVQKTSGTSVKDLLITDLPDDGKQIFLHYTFDDPTCLTRIVKETTFRYSNQLNIIYDILKFTEDESGLKFKNTVRIASRQFDDSLALSVFGPVLATKKITQQIEFPFDVTATNASTQADNGKVLTWETSMYDIMYNQVEMTADLTKPEGLDLPYVEKVDKTVGKVSQKDNPLIRVQVYNGNQEPIKIGTGVILKDNELVTNFALMDLLAGGGFFSVILGNDSLAGIDEMHEKDIDPKQDLVFLRFTNNAKSKYFKIADMASAIYGSKVKIYYYPNALSSVVYSIDGSVTGIKKWTKNTSLVEVKPSKPLSPDGGAVFNEAGEFVGMITQAFQGEVGKIYVIPGSYIRSRLP